MKNIANLFRKLKDPKILIRFLVVLVIVLLIIGVIFYEETANRVKIDNSLIEAPITTISPTNPGVLSKLYVHLGQTVQQGDPIAEVGDQTIRASADGMIIQADNLVGSIISAQNSPIEMIKDSDLRVVGTIDENKGLKDIKPGQAVSFTVDAFPSKSYWGYVDEVSPTAKQTQLAFAISSERPTQQFEVYVKFNPQKYPELLNGMSAKITIFTKTP
ncbi:efflux RND transporter periplasmic adaptor subunit [Patescibacteria group bacterium]|nr:efflux RND transporter periplasmic adaptor subunit [Patescibacteria group bacterium]MCL5409360.1 efflux RND transporter periplasmic adaptor subunit [Patescibacteria group bacterium]